MHLPTVRSNILQEVVTYREGRLEISSLIYHSMYPKMLSMTLEEKRYHEVCPSVNPKEDQFVVQETYPQ